MKIHAIYGAEDKAHAIYCTITKCVFISGEPFYIAEVQGERVCTIQAPPSMFHYQFTAIIKDADGNDKSRTGYYPTATAAHIDAVKHADKGDTVESIIFA